MADTNRGTSTAVMEWNVKLAEMKANRDTRFGRTPVSNSLEDRLVKEMEAIFERLTPEERSTVERPIPPRRVTSLIAQDQYGRLIGYEDLDDY